MRLSTASSPAWKSNCRGASSPLPDHCLDAIDATPARWRGGAGSHGSQSQHGRVSTRSTRWLISTRAGAHGHHLHAQRARAQVHGAPVDRVSLRVRALGDGPRLARQHRLVDRRRAAHDDAVGGHREAGRHEAHVAAPERRRVDRLRLVVAEHHRARGLELEQGPERAARLALGARLEVLAQQDEGDQQRGRLEVVVAVEAVPVHRARAVAPAAGPVVRRRAQGVARVPVRRRRAQRHERVHRRRAPPQRLDRARVEPRPEPELDRRRQEQRPERLGREVPPLRAEHVRLERQDDAARPVRLEEHHDDEDGQREHEREQRLAPVAPDLGLARQPPRLLPGQRAVARARRALDLGLVAELAQLARDVLRAQARRVVRDADALQQHLDRHLQYPRRQPQGAHDARRARRAHQAPHHEHGLGAVRPRRVAVARRPVDAAHGVAGPGHRRLAGPDDGVHVARGAAHRRLVRDAVRRGGGDGRVRAAQRARHGRRARAARHAVDGQAQRDGVGRGGRRGRRGRRRQERRLEGRLRRRLRVRAARVARAAHGVLERRARDGRGLDARGAVRDGDRDLGHAGHGPERVGDPGLAPRARHAADRERRRRPLGRRGRGAEADGLDGGDERRERQVRVRVDARDAARQIHLGASHAADALQGLLHRANAVAAGHAVHAEADRRSAHDQSCGAVLSAAAELVCRNERLASVRGTLGPGFGALEDG